MTDFLSIAQDLVQKSDSYLETHGHLEFHQEASDLLARSEISQAFDLKSFTENALKQSFLITQNYGASQFSDLPITVAKGKHCFLDLYFWRRRPTVIHTHHLSGALLCLEGRNVDLEFEFTASRKLGAYITQGDVRLKHSNHLGPGDVKGIPFLDRFIHQTHHHADLTLNLCLRTPEIGEENLSNYLFSGLKYEKGNLLLSRYDRLSGFIRLTQIDPEKLDLTLDDAIYFVIQNFHSTSESVQFKKVYEYLLRKIREETGLDLVKLLRDHDQMYDSIQAEYD